MRFVCLSQNCKIKLQNETENITAKCYADRDNQIDQTVMNTNDGILLSAVYLYN